MGCAPDCCVLITITTERCVFCCQASAVATSIGLGDQVAFLGAEPGWEGPDLTATGVRPSTPEEDVSDTSCLGRLTEHKQRHNQAKLSSPFPYV